MRGIFPVVATVDRERFLRVDDDELARRTANLLKNLRSQREGATR